MTRVKEIWKIWDKGEGRNGRMLFKTIPATPDDGKSPMRRKRRRISGSV